MSSRILYFFLAVAAVGQVPATLTPTPAALSFVWVEGAALPVAQTVSVKAGTSLVGFTAVAPQPWITVTPAAGNLPVSLSVLVNPSGLPVGTYNVAITFTAVGFAPITIPVTLTVEAPLPTLVLSATSLAFISNAVVPVPQTLTLTTTGGPVAFSATVASAAWMTVSPSSGVVLPGLPITLTVSVNPVGFAPSTAAYAGKITIGASNVATGNASQTVAVTMTVQALNPTITSLYPNAALMGTGALTVTVSGTGFYKGGTTATAGAVPLATPTYVNPTTILVVLPASVLAAAGTVNVSTVNPAPGGISAPSVFTVSATPVVQAMVSAASYATGPVAPGEFVTLFGTGIGPVVPAGMQVVAGYAAMTLGGVSVTIDGQSAAMIYVSANQLTLQVPYTATLGLARVVTVTNGVLTEPFVGGVDIQATAPGLFLVSGVVGQCAALRFNALTSAVSVNASTNAALAGDQIEFYVTGEGIYDLDPLATSGYVVPAGALAPSPLPQLSPLPVVTIGGAVATVTYAGVVPGGLLGLMQINAIVPAASTKGNAVPVSIVIGGVSTQVGATVAVK